MAAIGTPSGAEAAWDYFGEIRFAGGWAENPGLLDSSQPASLRGGQMEAASRLSLGARSEWEKTDFEFSYSPYGEIYEDSDLNQLSHALGLSWDHRFTQRLSLSLREDFNYNPKLPTDPNGADIGGALSSDSSITASDFRQSLSLRATQKSTLDWTYRNILRNYSFDQLLDTSGNAFGMDYSRTFGPLVVVSAGYEFGVYSFSDGLPPPVPSDLETFCAAQPLDPNCIAFTTAAAQPPAEDQGFGRHRAYAGYAYDSPPGFHFDIDAGYDQVVFSESDSGSVSEPFARTSLGWNGTRFYTRVGYEQGLDEGGGVVTVAELKRGWADGLLRFTDNASLELSVSRDVRRSLDYDGAPAETTLTTLRGMSSFTYKLSRAWALIAVFTHDKQTATGTSAVPSESRANRYGLGASWTFEP